MQGNSQLQFSPISHNWERKSQFGKTQNLCKITDFKIIKTLLCAKISIDVLLQWLIKSRMNQHQPSLQKLLTFCALSFWKTNTGGAMAGLSVGNKRSLVNHTSKRGEWVVWFKFSSRQLRNFFWVSCTHKHRNSTAKTKLCICVVLHCFNCENHNALNSSVHKVPWTHQQINLSKLSAIFGLIALLLIQECKKRLIINVNKR